MHLSMIRQEVVERKRKEDSRRHRSSFKSKLGESGASGGSVASARVNKASGACKGREAKGLVQGWKLDRERRSERKIRRKAHLQHVVGYSSLGYLGRSGMSGAASW
jgi:hypothetical protein